MHLVPAFESLALPRVISSCFGIIKNLSLPWFCQSFKKFEVFHPGLISRFLIKGGSRYNAIKWIRPNCNHAHVFRDRDMII